MAGLRALVSQGYVGQQVRRVEVRLHVPLWPRVWQEAWVGRRAQGGVVRELGSHLLFAVLELFGGDLHAIARVLSRVEYPLDDADAAEHGVTALLELSRSASLGDAIVSMPQTVLFSALANVGVPQEECESIVYVCARMFL
jgi:predicted dehydrogenase